MGGGGRERPSGREPPPEKLLRLYQTAQGSVSGPTSACRQASAKKRNQPPKKPTPHIRMPRLLSTSAESTTITTIPRTIRKPTPTACLVSALCQPRRSESPWCYLSSCLRIDHKKWCREHRRVGSTQVPRKPRPMMLRSGRSILRATSFWRLPNGHTPGSDH